MFQNFILWMQEPGKWNDGVVLCAVVGIVCLVGMLISDFKEKRKVRNYKP